MKCLYCETEFERTKNVQKYCTKECWAKSRRSQIFIPDVVKTCVNCKKQFQANRTWQKFCNIECQKEHTAKERQNLEVQKVCPHCNKTFFTVKKRKKFCTEYCRKKSTRIRRYKPKKVKQIIVYVPTKREDKIKTWNNRLKNYWHEYGC